MNCPKCGHEMTLGSTLALCPNCGTTAQLPEGHQAPKAPEPASELAPVPVVSEATMPAVDHAHPEPGVVFQSASAPMTAMGPSAGPSVGMGGGVAEPPKRRLHLGKKLLVVLALVVLTAGGGGAYAYYSFVMQPKTALLSYLDKLAATKTGSYNGTLSYHAKDEESSLGLDGLSVSVNGKFDVSEAKNPKTQATVTGKSAAYSVSAELRELDKTVFFKLGDLGLVQNFGLPLSKDWYKIQLDDNTFDKCRESTKKSNNVFGVNIPSDLPLKDVKLVSMMETVAGHSTRHYSGKLDNSKLQGFIDAANNDLSADCKITLKASDLDDTVVSYELWTGRDFDRLKLMVSATKEKVDVEGTFDTSGYNQPVKIEAPSGAKTLDDILSGVNEGDTSVGSVPAAAKARDTQRKTDLTVIRKGLEEYFVNNNYYPATLAELTTGSAPFLKTIPVDPTNKAPYSYVYAVGPMGCKKDACIEYTLTAKLENAQDQGANVENGTFTLVNAN